MSYRIEITRPELRMMIAEEVAKALREERKMARAKPKSPYRCRKKPWEMDELKERITHVLEIHSGPVSDGILINRIRTCDPAMVRDAANEMCSEGLIGKFNKTHSKNGRSILHYHLPK